MALKWGISFMFDMLLSRYMQYTVNWANNGQTTRKNIKLLKHL